MRRVTLRVTGPRRVAVIECTSDYIQFAVSNRQGDKRVFMRCTMSHAECLDFVARELRWHCGESATWEIIGYSV